MSDFCRVSLPQFHAEIEVPAGSCLFSSLRDAGCAPDSYCGGTGKCGKCTVLVNGEERLSCCYSVFEDIVVELPEHFSYSGSALDRTDIAASGGQELSLAFDIGTTTVVGAIVSHEGAVLGKKAVANPQISYGADVVSRIRSALSGSLHKQSVIIRRVLTEVAELLLEGTGLSVDKVNRIAVVGNPAMQQLFLGMEVQNLVDIPYHPAITETGTESAADLLPSFRTAKLLTVPDISAYVGADTVADILSTRMFESEKIHLLVDIGTNGEMVLGGSRGMLACATAAGPALEGANISCGMRGTEGAISSVSLIDGKPIFTVIGGGEAKGICGSGLIDAIAVYLDLGLLNKRGRILTESGTLPLCNGLLLTQQDVNAFQLAKGAIAAGIQILAGEYGILLNDIDEVILAGAFGCSLNPNSARRTGLLPAGLPDRIRNAGNAACDGAVLIASDDEEFSLTDRIASQVKCIDLGTNDSFKRCFARSMYFDVMNEKGE